MSHDTVLCLHINPLTGTLKPQKKGPIRRLVHWPSVGELGAAQSSPRCTKCNSPLIDGQCTYFILFDVALCPLKG